MHDIQLTMKQAEYVLNANHRWNMAVGAVRSGKSYLAITYIIPRGIISRKGKRGINLILGATKENIERNVLTPMRDFWGSKYISDINTRNWADIFGEKVYCIGAESIKQVSKLRGSEIKFCYCDEICDINEEVFEVLKSRLSLAYSECHAAANPVSPNHFIKKFIDSANDGVDVYNQHYTIYDNPFLPVDFVKSIEAEYVGTVYFDRYIKGLWTQAEGLIYPNYMNALEEPYDGEIHEYCISLDYGTQNAFAALKWVRGEDSIWHLIDEYYYSGRDSGHQKTDNDYVMDIVNFVRDIEDEYITIIVDPSATSFIASLRRNVDRKFKVRQADNNVADGIRETAACMQSGMIRISNRLTEIQREFAGYIWDNKLYDDKPIKYNDHLMDAMRYFVKTKRVYKPKMEYTSIFKESYSPIFKERR